MLSDLAAILHGKKQLMLPFHCDGLHLIKEHILIKLFYAKNYTACFHQLTFRYVLGIAPPELIGFLPSADPGGALSADLAGVPQLSGVMSATAAANHLHGERIFLSSVIIRKASHLLVPCKLLLYTLEGVHIDDCFMVILHQVLRQFPRIQDLLFGNRVFDECLLEKGIPGVSDVPKNEADRTYRKGLAVDGSHTLSKQFLRCFHVGAARKEVVENPLYHLSFFGNNGKFPVHPLVPKNSVAGISNPLLKGFVDRPFCILADGLALCLCHRCHEREHQFALLREGINVLFLKTYRNSKFP